MRPARVLGIANPMSFPDDMSDDEIKAILQQKFNADTMKRATGEISDALTPVESMAAPYGPSLMEKASLGIGGALHDSGIISNKSGAYQVGKNVTALGEMLPGVGDVADIDSFLKAKAEGDELGMGLAMLGTIPIAGELAKKAGKAVSDIKVSKSPFDLGGAVNDRLSIDGSHIDVVESKWSPTKFSIVEFLTDEKSRGQGKGGKLLDEAITKYGDELSGAFSSKESLTAAYNRGFRPIGDTNKSKSLDQLTESLRGGESVTMSFDSNTKPPVDVASNINQQGVLNEELANATNQRPIQESIRIRGGIGLLDEQNRANQAFSREVNGTLKGLPVDIPGFTPRHSEDISNTAKNYVEGLGERYSPPSTYAKVDPERAGEIAKLYDSMPHNPSDPEVKEAYSAMIDEVEQQYQAAIDGGLKVEFIDFDKMGDPYNGSPRQATEDILNNNHMYVFSTRDGFGSSDAFDPIDNPMLKETSFEISGQKALANDLFRAVHDYFGHAKEGVGFRAAGEENAWRNHSAMFSKKARRALTTETRGQNNWLNFGPYGESNRSAQTSDTVFADQKIGLLPEWVSESFDDVSAATPYKKAINE